MIPPPDERETDTETTESRMEFAIAYAPDVTTISTTMSTVESKTIEIVRARPSGDAAAADEPNPSAYEKLRAGAPAIVAPAAEAPVD